MAGWVNKREKEQGVHQLQVMGQDCPRQDTAPGHLILLVQAFADRGQSLVPVMAVMCNTLMNTCVYVCVNVRGAATPLDKM